VDPAGWWFQHPSSLLLEHSTSGPGMVTFTEVTVANFAQRRAVIATKTGLYVHPPLNSAGRFPADGIAFRMFLLDGGPAPFLNVPDSRFPVELSTFAPAPPDSLPTGYGAREVTQQINADGEQYVATAVIGPAASANARAMIAAVVASLRFPLLKTGEVANGEEIDLGPAGRYPVGSFTLVHAPGAICDGKAFDCHSGSAPFYLVHAPGRLPPSLINPCKPTAAACTPPGAFYAIGWTDEDILGGYRSACQLHLDRSDKQFYCTNSTARWDRTGAPLVVPRGPKVRDGLQVAFAKVAWNGDVVLLSG